MKTLILGFVFFCFTFSAFAKTGYYTDKGGVVRGYWNLPEVPVNGEYRWIESQQKPPIVPTDEENQMRNELAQKAQLWRDELKIELKSEIVTDINKNP